MNATTTSTPPTRTLLLPERSQFPFDEICRRLIVEAQARDFRVPGVEFEFEEFGRGDALFAYVRQLRIPSLQLLISFCRTRAKADDPWVVAPNRIVYGTWELVVYSEESSPTLFQYIGGDEAWELDKAAFFDEHAKFKGKLRDVPGLYLEYQGWSQFGGVRPENMHLVRHEGLTDEFRAGQKHALRTNAIFKMFEHWLVYRALPVLLETPVPDQHVDPFHREPVPLPAGLDTLYCYSSGAAAQRIVTGQTRREELPADERYGLWWPNCGIGEITAQTSFYTLGAPYWQEAMGPGYFGRDDYFLFAIRPTTAAGIFVTDHNAFVEAHKGFFATMEPDRPGGQRLTDGELNLCLAAERRTRIPITEYRGNYVKPIVHIEREVRLEEVTVVSGPWPACQYVQVVVAAGGEAARLLKLAVTAYNARQGLFGPGSEAYGEALTVFLGALTTLDGFDAAYADFLSHERDRVPVEWRLFAGSIVRAAAAMLELGLYSQQ